MPVPYSPYVSLNGTCTDLNYTFFTETTCVWCTLWAFLSTPNESFPNSDSTKRPKSATRTSNRYVIFDEYGPVTYIQCFEANSAFLMPLGSRSGSSRIKIKLFQNNKYRTLWRIPIFQLANRYLLHEQHKQPN